MLGLLLGLVDPISRIAGKIADAKVATANAQTDREKIAAEERVNTLLAKQAVLIAEAGQRVNSLMRAGFALPFIIYNAKLVVWDKVLGLGSTDGLSSELFQIELACIGFYFLHSIVDRLKR